MHQYAEEKAFSRSLKVCTAVFCLIEDPLFILKFYSWHLTYIEEAGASSFHFILQI